ncbi:hypothetical protein BH18ACI4_BH18ACI4_03930 [soil metagenome]
MENTQAPTHNLAFARCGGGLIARPIDRWVGLISSPWAPALA